MIGDKKEVLFGEFCPGCEFAEKLENEEPCNECLEQAWNIDSHKPINWKEMTEETKKSLKN